MSLNIGIVGATGMVGQAFMELLNKRSFPCRDLRLFASASSSGKTVLFRDQKISLKTLTPECFKGLDVVFFSSEDDISVQWAPIAVEQGAFAIDNSSAFRMNTDTPLIVPEVNAHLLPKKNNPCIIANPNCSTIQLVVALKPLQKKWGLKEVRLSTYQAVSGAGKKATQELQKQQSPLSFNCLPQIGSLDEGGFYSEEKKIINETKKILEDPELKVSAFSVRVPVLNGHSEAVWCTLKTPPETQESICELLEASPGLVLHRNQVPTAKEISGTYPVHVGRVHKDLDFQNTWRMWVVADNIYKGAALNGLQIAEHIFDITPDI